MGIIRKKTTIVIAILLVVLFISYIYFSNLLQNNASQTVVMEPMAFEEISKFEQVKLPINTSEEAIKYAVRSGSVYSRIEEVNTNADFSKWKLKAKLREGYSNAWEVIIESSGMLPSYTCAVYITQEGQLSPTSPDNALCRYNK